MGYNTTSKEVSYYNLSAPATSTFSITFTASTTLNVNFNNYLYGTGTFTFTTNSTVSAYAFSGGVVGGTYTILLIISGSTLTLTLTNESASITNRANFTSVVSTTSGSPGAKTNPKYIILTVTYDGTNYYISASEFNN